MALPFLVILAGIIFTMTRAALVRGEAIEQARNRAWHSRFGGGGGSLPAGAGAQVLGTLAERSANAGLQTGSGSKGHGHVEYLAPANQYFFFGSVSSSAQHAVFSDTWDHEVFPFAQQAPLTLDHRVFVFGAVGGVLQLFGELTQALQPPHSAIEAWHTAQHAVDTITDKIDELDREVERIQDKLDRLHDRVETAFANKNNALVRELEAEIERLQKVLARVREAREVLVKGKNLLPQP
jgi:hypothetical protein